MGLIFSEQVNLSEDGKWQISCVKQPNQKQNKKILDLLCLLLRGLSFRWPLLPRLRVGQILACIIKKRLDKFTAVRLFDFNLFHCFSSVRRSKEKCEEGDENDQIRK